MSEKALVVTTKPLDVQRNLSIDKNDIIAIQVSKAEQLLNKELSAAQATMQTNDKHLKNLLKEQDKDYKDTAEAAIQIVKDSVKAIQDRGFSGAQVRTNLQPSAAGLEVGAMIGGGYNSITFSKTIPFTQTQKDQQAEIEATKEGLANAQAAVVAAKQRLAKLPTLERQYRALLAERTLASSEEGQQILDALASDQKADILALPAV